MFAQVITPMLSGLFMDEIHFKTLFPYSAICVGLSLVTMLFVKHGDVKAPIKAKEDLIEHLDIAD
jgi:hypothetical protein